MFSKEEAKKLRQDFWITFGKRTALLPSYNDKKKKWLLFNTGVKDLSFKFESERKFARVCIDFEQKNLLKRLKYWEKFESLKHVLQENVPGELIWDEGFVLDNGKEIARIYTQLDGVSLYNTKKWPEIFDFFVENMTAIEEVFFDYKEFIKAIDA
jgi:hypothetical protein